MSGSQKGGAYARALARELPLEHGDLRAIASRLGLQVREVDADGFDGALIRAREIPLGTIAVRQSIREAGARISRSPLKSLTFCFPITTRRSSFAPSPTSGTGATGRENSSARPMNLPPSFSCPLPRSSRSSSPHRLLCK